MAYFTLVFIIALLVWALRIHITTKYRRKHTDHIPGPYVIPILGCVVDATTVKPTKVIEKANEFKQLYGSFVKGWILDRLFMITSDVELVEQLLSHPTQIRKSSLYNTLKPWLGTGLLMSDSQKWHVRRKIITPTFHFAILDKFLEVFDRQSTILNNCLSERADGRSAFDVLPYISSATLDIVTESAMGVNVHAQTDKTMPYTIAVKEMTKLIFWRCLRAHLHHETMFSILCPLKKLRQTQLIKLLHNFTTNVIEERRRELEKQLRSERNNEQNHDRDNIGTRKHMALLDVLLQATIDGQPLSNEDIREEVDTFMFEGHDTTTAALSFTLFLVSRHPEVQKMLLSEIYTVFGETNIEPFTMTKLNDLKYMECVIKESLRLYPPVPLIGREITEDFHYSKLSEIKKWGNGIIPASTQMFIFVYHTMRDPQAYENPTEFIPDRYKESATNPFSNIPFSAGPRNCIGQRFAMMEIKIILCKVLREYELLPLGQDIKPMLGLILRSETGMHLGMKKRASLCLYNSLITTVAIQFSIVDEMAYFTVVFIIVLFVWALRIHIITKYRRKYIGHIPGPYVIPILGCVSEATTVMPSKAMEKANEMVGRYGHIIKGWILDHLFIVTADVELIEQILAHPTQIRKSYLYNILKPWLGTGLLISDSEKWHARRKIITPTFHFAILEKCVKIFDRQSTVLINCLMQRADGTSAFDVMPYICSATLDIITESAMGVNVHAQTDKSMPYTMAVKELMQLIVWRCMRAYLHEETMFSILCPLKKLQQTKLIQLMHNFTRNIIEKRRQELEKLLNSGKTTEQNLDDIGARKHMALLDVLLLATMDGRPLSNDDIQEEVDTFMFGGHDTITTALSFTLYLVSRHPDIQKMLLYEIYVVFGDINIEPFTMVKLNELKYMECVIKESLRLYPPVAIIGREIFEDLHYNGVIPASTQVIISLYHTMRNPQAYENPTEFIPDRHSDSHVKNPFSYIPFSGGPRNCIGQRFAMLEIKMILCKVLREYELLPLGQDIKLLLGIILRSETGVQLGMKKRVST
ncbi:uncharacterized protein LOC133334087 [Musca vetustissima]|uniref:uncharacterized protein LOC133334087 n=1 Tax=Musca vetustissima TaxID=27455 RepID=UPI002AB6C8B5|nr:uncharacterized protein LOC133334087 [Musca vetustissima]